MDKDMHYYGIGFLARAAGFTKQQALTIAYASQYVDNSTESEPIRVGNLLFDPVRTAHYGLKAFHWGVQKKIFIPFHFIPPHPFDPASGKFTFITERNSAFANMIFKQVAKKSPDELSRLIGIGIVLHTLADSWAHHGFAGNKDPINDVESIYHYKDGKWVHLTLENIYLDILPEVGHAQAGFNPEYPFLRWKYTRNETKEEVERNNPREYIHAAQTIHRLLASVKKTETAPLLSWKEIESPIRTLLTDPEFESAKRCDKWRDLYQSFFGDTSDYQYDPKKWRREALDPKDEKDLEWDDFKQADFGRLAFSGTSNFYETPWVKFHKAALRQRNFVLEHLL